MRILIGLAIVVAIIVGGVSLYLDRFLKAQVEAGATEALGVETTIGSLRLGILGGELRLADLEVANPEGFEGETLLALRSGHVSVSLASLLSDTIEVGDITLDGLEVLLEQSGRQSNYGELMKNLETTEAQAKAAEPSESAAGPNIVIRELLIRDTTAKVELLAGQKSGKSFSVNIPEIRLENIGAGGETGMPLASVVGTVTKAVLTAVAKQGGDLPSAVASQLRAGLGRLEPGGYTGGTIDEAIEGTQKEAEKLLDGARGLFGRGKDDD
jgi:uncharacterized protein involved in outer membrane biogenesis